MSEKTTASDNGQQKNQKESQLQLSSDEWTVAKRIIKALNESDEAPRRQVNNIIRFCGSEFAEQMLQETLKVEADGGMMTENGKRQRTIGGVFFYLARGKMPDEQRSLVFPRSRREQSQKRKWFYPNRPEFIWSQRGELLQRLLNLKKHGRVRDMRVKLTGRPGHYEKLQEVVVLSMKYEGTIPSFPAGVPPMPDTPTIYTVYVGYGQWNKVEKLLKDTSKMLEIEGICAFDPEINGIAVFATAVSMKKIKTKKEAPKAAPNTLKQVEVKKAKQPPPTPSPVLKQRY